MNRTLFLALLAVSVSAQVPATPNPITPVLNEGQVMQLEAQVAANPGEIASRALLGKNYAYFILGITELGDWDQVISVDPAKSASEFATHARQQLAESSLADVCGEGGNALWNGSFHVEGPLKAGPQVMSRIDADRTLAVKALERAIILEPAEEKWHGYRAHTLMLRTRFKSGLQLTAAEAFNLIVQDMASLKGIARDALLPTVARLALDAQAPQEARAYALEMIEKAKNTRHGYRGNLVFYGNTVLGQLALRAGNPAQAAEYLLAAGKTPGSPQLNSFGPNMSLAKEMIEAGHKEPVRQFFDECSLFWRLDRGRLKTWAALMDSNQMPNFGANLVY